MMLNYKKMRFYIAYFDNKDNKWVTNFNSFITNSPDNDSSKIVGQFLTSIWFSKFLDQDTSTHLFIYGMNSIEELNTFENEINKLNKNIHQPMYTPIWEIMDNRNFWYFNMTTGFKTFVKKTIVSRIKNGGESYIGKYKIPYFLNKDEERGDLQLYFKFLLMNKNDNTEYSNANMSEQELNDNYRLYITLPEIRVDLNLILK